MTRTKNDKHMYHRMMIILYIKRTY